MSIAIYIKSLGERFVLCCRMTQIGVGSTILHVSIFVTKTSDIFKTIKRQEKNLWMVKLSLFNNFFVNPFCHFETPFKSCKKFHLNKVITGLSKSEYRFLVLKSRAFTHVQFLHRREFTLYCRNTRILG